MTIRIEAFIQARMGSTRLPGKVLKTVKNKPLLAYLVERLRCCEELDDIVILTTEHSIDDSIVAFCKENNIRCFRGSEEDVLDRYYQAGLERKVDAIVRITADCPLIDPVVVDQVVHQFRKEYPKFDYISNTLERTYPRGLDVEVFSFESLAKAAKNATLPQEREHVTLHFYTHPKEFALKNMAHVPSLGHHRWTVDTPEDFALVRLILENVHPMSPDFRLVDVLDLLSQNPDWINLNAHIKQKA